MASKVRAHNKVLKDEVVQLKDALRAAHEVAGFVLIECLVGTSELSPLGRRYIRGSARKARARRSPKPR